MLRYDLITGRNEVLAKVIFLHLSVIHSVNRGGVVPDQTPPPGPGTPPDHTPPPPEQQPPEYGQRSAGTHPTGIHSCIYHMSYAF